MSMCYIIVLILCVMRDFAALQNSFKILTEKWKNKFWSKT